MKKRNTFMLLLAITVCLTSCKSNDVEISQNGAENVTEISSKKDYMADSTNIVNNSSDLLYREYQIGTNMATGKVICSKEVITDNSENPQAIVIFYNDTVKETIPYEWKDIEYEIIEAGTYAFFVLDESKSLVDISEKISDFVDANADLLIPVK